MLVRTIRCLRACFLGLFIVAQVAGIVPLMYDHTLNVFETTPVAGHAHRHVAAVAAPDEDPPPGVLDLHDQCCALHTLAGPLPHFVNAALIDFTGRPIAPAKLTALAQRGPALLDRPPRSLPLI